MKKLFHSFISFRFKLQDGDNPGKSFLLVSQNKSLSRELIRSKRSVIEARKELELMRRKSREMESLVSLIQRAWSQVSYELNKRKRISS